MVVNPKQQKGTNIGKNKSNLPPTAAPTEALGGSAYGTAANPNYAYSTTILDNTPLSEFGSQNPQELASAWGLPYNVGELNLQTGQTTTKAADPASLFGVQVGLQMMTLYEKFYNYLKSPKTAGGLSKVQLQAAEKMGGDIGRAAQMLNGSLGKKGNVAAIKESLASANGELLTRLNSKFAGNINPEDLTKQGFAAKVPQGFANIMRNAGYAVTSGMTFAQALGAAGGGQKPAPQLSQGQTVNQLLQSLVNGGMSRDQITALQENLFQSGLYDPSYEDGSKSYTPGQLDTGTIQALRTAILHTRQLQTQGQNVTLEDVISGGTDLGTFGGTPEQGGIADTPPVFVPQATGAQLQGTLDSQFESAMGRKPTAQDLAGFTQYMDSLQTAGSTAEAKAGQAQLAAEGGTDPTTGISLIPGVASPTQAAQSYIQQNGANETTSHGVANAFGMLMNLIGSPSVNTNGNVGNQPTSTS